MLSVAFISDLTKIGPVAETEIESMIRTQNKRLDKSMMTNEIKIVTRNKITRLRDFYSICPP